MYPLSLLWNSFHTLTYFVVPIETSNKILTSYLTQTIITSTLSALMTFHESMNSVLCSNEIPIQKVYLEFYHTSMIEITSSKNLGTSDTGLTKVYFILVIRTTSVRSFNSFLVIITPWYLSLYCPLLNCSSGLPSSLRAELSSIPDFVIFCQFNNVGPDIESWNF